MITHYLLALWERIAYALRAPVPCEPYIVDGEPVVLHSPDCNCVDFESLPEDW